MEMKSTSITESLATVLRGEAMENDIGRTVTFAIHAADGWASCSVLLCEEVLNVDPV